MERVKGLSKSAICVMLACIMIFSLMPAISASAADYSYDANGFAIVDGTLVDYKGSGGDIVIPAGVTKIATGSLTSVECTSISLPKGLKSIESSSVNFAFGAKIYLPSDWEGGCEIPKYGINDYKGPDFLGCSIVVPADIKVVDTNFMEANKIIVTGAKDDSYKNASWYGNVKAEALSNIPLPVVREEDFDGNGFVIKDGVLITYDGRGGDLEIPDTVNEIGPLAFAGLDIFDHISIPDNVTKAGDACFAKLQRRCSFLGTGNGLTELPDRFFETSMGCETLILGNKIQSIGYRALEACYAHEIRLPESVKKIGEEGLWFVDNIKSIDLSHVEEFEGELFYFTSGKKTVDVIDLSSAKSIDTRSLEKITADKLIIGPDLENLGWGGLPKVNEEIVWPENGKLRKLPEDSISNISVLENSPLPDYIENIESYAASGTAAEIRLPYNLKTLGESALPVKTDGRIILPSGWTGTSEVDRDAFMVSYGTKESNFSLVIPTDIKGIEDSLINANGIETFVIQNLPGETSYRNKEWYKKLVATGKTIVEEDSTYTRVELDRIENTNEYEVRIKSARVSEDAGFVDVVIDIPEGLSFVENSYTGKTGKLVSATDKKVTISIPTDEFNDVSIKLVQDELYTEKKDIIVEACVSGSEEVLSGKDTAVYCDFDVTAYEYLDKIKVFAKGNPNEKVELYVNSEKYDLTFDNMGRLNKTVNVDKSPCEVYLRHSGFETKHEIIDIKLESDLNVDVKRLTVTHQPWGNGPSYTTDITEDGKVITVYPGHIFTFELNGTDLDKVEKDLKLVCGKTTLPVKKVNGKYIAQGFIDFNGMMHGDNTRNLVQIKCANDVLFETNVKWIIDPSGYVYEICPKNRVEGATATIYYSAYESGKNAVKWDAENYGQQNDLVTGADGFYAWDVPEGYYRVVVDKNGYTTAKSEWLPVPPVQLDVNLAIKDMRAARVKCVAMEDDHINIYFDKYMNENQVVDIESYTLGDGVNKIAISKAVAFDKASDAKGNNYAKAVRLDFEKTLTGEQLKRNYNLRFAMDKFSTYFGIKSFLATITGIKVAKEVTDIKVDKGTAVRLGNNIEVIATLLPLGAAAGQKVRATVADSSVAKVLSVSKVDSKGNVKIVLEGENYGQTDVKITLENGAAEATIPVFVAIDSEVKKTIQETVGIAKLPVEKDKSGNIALEDGEQPETPKDDKNNDKKNATTESSKNNSNSKNTPVAPKVGSTVKVGKAKYVIGKKYTVTYKCSTNKKASSVTIPATVKIKGKTYKVTAIAANAFKNNKKLKKVSIGKNVKTIGKSAFYGCKNLKTVTIKTTKLKSKTVGKNAFAKINAKAKIKVPKSKLKSYKKLLKSKGIKGKKQKIKK